MFGFPFPQSGLINVVVYLSNNTAVYFVTAGFVPLLSAAAKGVSGRPGNVVNISSLSGITKW